MKATLIRKTYPATRAGLEQACQEFEVSSTHERINSLMISLFVWGNIMHERVVFTINLASDTGLSNGTFTVRRS